MTIKINRIDDGIGIEIVATGSVTGEEIIEAHQEIYSTENLKRQKYQIIDRTECTEYIVSNEEVKEIAAIDTLASKTNPEIIIAVISSTDLQFGISRVWQAYVEESNFLTQVFRDKVEAKKWLEGQLNKTK